MKHKKLLLTVTLLFGGVLTANAQLPDVGPTVSPSAKEQEALVSLKGKVTGEIVLVHLAGFG